MHDGNRVDNKNKKGRPKVPALPKPARGQSPSKCEFWADGWLLPQRNAGATAFRTASHYSIIVQAGISSSHATAAMKPNKLAAAVARKSRSIVSMESPLHYSDTLAACASASAAALPNDTLEEIS